MLSSAGQMKMYPEKILLNELPGRAEHVGSGIDPFYWSIRLPYGGIRHRIRKETHTKDTRDP